MEAIFLAYDTAWWYWQNSKQAPTTLAVASRRSQSKAAIASASFIRDTLRGGVFSGQPLVVSAQPQSHGAFEGVSFRRSSARLPRGSYVQLSSNVCISSPELSFLQYAEDKSLYQVILYGFALCGTFVLDPNSRSGTSWRAALTSVKKLAAFVEKCDGIRGVKRARQALRYIQDGSASPRESQTAMLLALPLCHGGYALPEFVMNGKVLIPPTLWKLSGRRSFRVDFLWREKRIAAEYDSETDHIGRLELCRDATKRIALQEMGFSTFGFTTLQIDDLDLMDESIRMLRKLLGVRVPGRFPAEYRKKQVRLRREIGLPT